jgi:hypothetical protein
MAGSRPATLERIHATPPGKMVTTARVSREPDGVGVTLTVVVMVSRRSAYAVRVAKT